jgi:hypothetical protein
MTGAVIISGLSFNSGSVVVEYPFPVISGINPFEAFNKGVVNIMISGSGFDDGLHIVVPNIRFTGTLYCEIISLSDTGINCDLNLTGKIPVVRSLRFVNDDVSALFESEPTITDSIIAINGESLVPTALNGDGLYRDLNFIEVPGGLAGSYVNVYVYSEFDRIFNVELPEWRIMTRIKGFECGYEVLIKTIDLKNIANSGIENLERAKFTSMGIKEGTYQVKFSNALFTPDDKGSMNPDFPESVIVAGQPSAGGTVTTAGTKFPATGSIPKPTSNNFGSFPVFNIALVEMMICICAIVILISSIKPKNEDYYFRCEL